MKLGIPASSASDAVNEFWKEWDKKESPEGRLYAVLESREGKWTALLCCQKISGGPLYKIGRSSTSKPEEIELPIQAFAMLPISELVTRVAKNLAEFIK